MAEAAMAAGAPRASRLDRRKARTHQALIDAAVRLIAEGRGERASIQEITEEADIGFGSFYNHFESKGQLFQAAPARASPTPPSAWPWACGSQGGSPGATPTSPGS